MPEAITISHGEVIHQLKLSCTIPLSKALATREIMRVAKNQNIEAGTAAELQQAADDLRLLNNWKLTPVAMAASITYPR